MESGEALDDHFHAMAADETERLQRAIVERAGDPRRTENPSDQDLRREVMNTVGKYGRLGADIRCAAESHRRVRAFVKNHNTGLEVPYRYGSEKRRTLPDFIVMVDDGHDDEDLLHLIVEIKSYRREDYKEKKATMDTYWVPGVNNLGTHGRWALAEFPEAYQIEAEYKIRVAGEFNKMIDALVAAETAGCLR